MRDVSLTLQEQWREPAAHAIKFRDSNNERNDLYGCLQRSSVSSLVSTVKQAAAKYSNVPLLDAQIALNGGSLPLAWVSSTLKVPFANFGDALSPVVLSALTGLPCIKRAFNSKLPRISAVGTIGQEQQNGTVHVWGSGFDSRRNPVDPAVSRYIRPPDTALEVHAVRGPLSRAALESAGVPAPPVYGDPGCFLPKILRPNVPKVHELGVVIHLSELSTPALECSFRPQIKRYNNADPSYVRLISTFHEPSWQGFTGKLEEILSCKRILSTSFHGLILPELYGIPSLYLHNRSGGFQYVNVAEAGYEYLDHRVADFYAGQNVKNLPVYSQPRDQLIDWDQVIDDIDLYAEAPEVDISALYHSLPVNTVVDLNADKWPISDSLVNSLKW